MTYEEIQVVSQIASLAIFASVMAVVLVLVFRRKNSKAFDNAASIPLRNDELTPER